MRKIFAFSWRLIFLSALVFGQQNRATAVDAIIPDFQVNENAGPAGAVQMRPDIAVHSSGDFMVVWRDYRNGDSDIYAQYYGSDGSPAGANFKVNDDEKSIPQASPAVAADSAGGFILVWQDYRNGHWDIYAQRYNGDGAPVGENFKINDDDAGAGHYDPAIAATASGGFVIAWGDFRDGDRNIYAQRFGDDGSPLGANFKINDDDGNAQQFSPAIAADSSGGLMVAWRDDRNGNADIYARRYDSDGAALGPNFKVNDDSGNTLQAHVDIAWHPSSGFVVTWDDCRNATTYIYGQRYDDDGSPIGSNFRVSGETINAPQYTPTVAFHSSGSFIIAWKDTRNGGLDIYAQLYDAAGAPVNQNFKMNDEGTQCSMPAISFDSPDGFVLTWLNDVNNDPDIYARRFDAQGAPLQQKFKVNDDVGGAWQNSPAIAVNGHGGFVIVWEDRRNGKNDIYGQRFGYDGSMVGQNFRINDDDESNLQSDPAVAFGPSGDFTVVWNDNRDGNWDIYAQRFGNDGAAIDINFKVNDDAGSMLQYSPDIAANPLGGYVIVWRDKRNGYANADIYARRYGDDGAPIGQNFKVNDDAGTAGQYRPAVACNASGGFVVVWHDLRDGDRDIYAQRYDSSGSLLGSNFKVNDNPLNTTQYEPDVAFTSSGDFIVTWEDYHSGNHNIYAQRYSADGSPIGVNFKVNEDDGGPQPNMPSVETDSADNFIIVWQDDRSGDVDIYAQRYNPDGSLLGGNFIVNAATDKNQVNPDVKLWGGRIYNTWASNHVGGAGYDIWANVLDWNNPTAVTERAVENVSNFQLFANYPNPFNPGTTIAYEVPKAGHVRLGVYNMLGEKIRVLVDGVQAAGRHQVRWNGRDERGRSLPSGVYLYRIEADGFRQTRRMVLFR